MINLNLIILTFVQTLILKRYMYYKIVFLNPFVFPCGKDFDLYPYLISDRSFQLNRVVQMIYYSCLFIQVCISPRFFKFKVIFIIFLISFSFFLLKYFFKSFIFFSNSNLITFIAKLFILLFLLTFFLQLFLIIPFSSTFLNLILLEIKFFAKIKINTYSQFLKASKFYFSLFFSFISIFNYYYDLFLFLFLD